MKLLNIQITSDFKMLKAGTTISFLLKARSANPTSSASIVQLAPTLFYPVEHVFVGQNSSGKTTLLQFISKVLRFLRTGRLPKNGFLYGSTFSFEVLFLEKTTLFRYQVALKAVMGQDNLIIQNESLSSANASTTLRKNLSNANFKPRLDFRQSVGYDTSKITTFTEMENDFTLEDYKGDYAQAFMDTYLQLCEDLDEATLTSLVQLFDDSVESLEVSVEGSVDGQPRFVFARKGETPVYATGEYLCSILSAGTIRGITLFGRSIRAFSSGGYIVIDEIENSFHKNLVDNLRIMFADPTINTAKASLIYSTHYYQLLDFGDRTDNIDIVMRDDSRIVLKNLSSDFHLRTDIVRSQWFDQNAFGTLTCYDRLMQIRNYLRSKKG